MRLSLFLDVIALVKVVQNYPDSPQFSSTSESYKVLREVGPMETIQSCWRGARTSEASQCSVATEVSSRRSLESCSLDTAEAQRLQASTSLSLLVFSKSCGSLAVVARVVESEQEDSSSNTYYTISWGGQHRRYSRRVEVAAANCRWHE